MAQSTEQEEKPPRILFKNSLVRKKVYWQFIYMVADPKVKKPFSGYTCKGCIALYCAKCDLELKYVSGDNKIISRHMTQKHMDDMLNFKEEEVAKKRKHTRSNFMSFGSSKRLKSSTRKEELEMQSLCASWITENLRPIQIVEDKGLERLIQYANSSNVAGCWLSMDVHSMAGGSSTGFWIGLVCNSRKSV